MSALPPKADMCSALADVCFGPKADSCCAAKRITIRSPRRQRITGETPCRLELALRVAFGAVQKPSRPQKKSPAFHGALQRGRREPRSFHLRWFRLHFAPNTDVAGLRHQE